MKIKEFIKILENLPDKEQEILNFTITQGNVDDREPLKN
jgi:hypothetical protein